MVHGFQLFAGSIHGDAAAVISKIPILLGHVNDTGHFYKATFRADQRSFADLLPQGAGAAAVRAVPGADLIIVFHLVIACSRLNLRNWSFRNSSIHLKLSVIELHHSARCLRLRRRLVEDAAGRS